MRVSEDLPADLTREHWKWKSQGGERELTWRLEIVSVETTRLKPLPKGGHGNRMESPAGAKSKPR